MIKENIISNLQKQIDELKTNNGGGSGGESSPYHYVLVIIQAKIDRTEFDIGYV